MLIELHFVDVTMEKMAKLGIPVIELPLGSKMKFSQCAVDVTSSKIDL